MTYGFFVAWCLCAFVLDYSARGTRTLVHKEER